VVDRPERPDPSEPAGSGVDLDTLEAATRAVSAVLDRDDPFRGPYTLEVSSPGLERVLRRPEHYAAAIGEVVSVKARGADGGAERLRGTLTATSTDTITLTTDAGDRTLRLDDVTQARTVFEWGPAPKPGKGSKPGSRSKGSTAGAKHGGASRRSTKEATV
jgi:ribosome maturation factor RimP